MPRIQITISDELSKKLNELKKFEKGAFVELALRQALSNSDIMQRFLWKTKKVDSATVPKSPSFEIDSEFK